LSFGQINSKFGEENILLNKKKNNALNHPHISGSSANVLWNSKVENMNIEKWLLNKMCCKVESIPKIKYTFVHIMVSCDLISKSSIWLKAKLFKYKLMEEIINICKVTFCCNYTDISIIKSAWWFLRNSWSWSLWIIYKLIN
jgi:hypothetical protein